MRIEGQGYIEVQPVYGHVGYVSAMTPLVYLTPEQRGVPAGSLAVLALALAVALAAARRAHNRWVWTLAGLVMIGAMTLGGAAVVAASRPQPRLLKPEFAATLYRLELASAATEGWQAAHGRLPTGAEWRKLAVAKGCALDGWGAPLKYEVLGKPGLDGQLYRVTSVPERDPTAPGWLRHEPSVLELSTEMLGPDGVSATQDDDIRIMRSLVSARISYSTSLHARTPRER